MGYRTMGEYATGNGYVHDFAELSSPKDSGGKPSPTQVRGTPTLFSDHPAIPVRRRRVEEDVSVVEGVATLTDATGRLVGETTYRERKVPMVKPNGCWAEQTDTVPDEGSFEESYV